MVKGFMGRTHALLSIMVLCIFLLIPIEIFKQSIWLLRNNILFFIVGIIVLVGGALLPDLDNAQSAAGSTLGFMGGMFTIFMQSTSSMVWNLVHTKKEKRPSTPHRYLWHTLVIGIAIFSIFYFGIPSGDIKIIDDIKQKTILVFLQKNVIILFFILILFMAVLCGSDMILSKLIKIFKLPKVLNYILPIAIIIYLFIIDYNHLKILGMCLGIGYICHCLEDCFADTGVPILWPIPIKGQFWKRCKFFITCQTGGLANNIIDIIVLVIDIGLLIIIFIQESAITI